MQGALALMLSLTLAAPTAEEIAQSEAFRDEAIAAFDGGDYEGAIEKFEAAYELDPEPSYLFNIGRVYEETGNLPEALEFYERFAHAPHLALEEREAAAARIRVIREVLGAEEAAKEEETPEPKPAEETQPSVTPKDTGPTKPQKRFKPLIAAGATLLGVGAAGAIAGGVGFGFAARKRSDRVAEVSAGNNPDGLTLSEVEDLDAEGRSFELLQIITASAGAALAVTGVVLMAIGLHRRTQAKRRVHVRAVWTPLTPGLVVGGRF